MSTGINDPAKCQWCGNFHQFKCPLVKSFEYENGLIKKVEFFSPNDYAPVGPVAPIGPITFGSGSISTKVAGDSR